MKKTVSNPSRFPGARAGAPHCASGRSTLRTAAALLAGLWLLSFVSHAEADSSGAGASAATQEFQFERVNGKYSRPDPDLAPVRRGIMTVHLRSPTNTLELLSHRLRLEPRGDGTHDAWLEARFQGEGTLEADLEIAGRTSTLTDEVSLPLQTVEVYGRIRLERQDGGFLVTALETQKTVKLSMKSRLASSLVGNCRQIESLLPLSLGCGSLQQGLSRASVPLPSAGETFLLSDTLLTSQDRSDLEAYLGL